MHSPPINEQNGTREPDPDAIKMFVGQLPRSMDESELTKMFEEYGSVHQLNVLRDKVSGQSKGCCFVTFYTRKAALEAQNALHNIKTMPGMHHPVQMKPADSEKRNEERKLFIGMINKKFDETEVKVMFEPFGTIEDCTVLRDQNGQSKGCAFITFSTRQSAQNCIKNMHHSQTMEGCSSALVVKFADTPREKEQKKMHQMNANMMSPSFGGGAAGGGMGMNMSPQYLAVLQQAMASGNLGNLGMLANMGNFGGLNIQQVLTLLAAASNNPGLLAALATLTGGNTGGIGSSLSASNTNIAGDTSNNMNRPNSAVLGGNASNSPGGFMQGNNQQRRSVLGNQVGGNRSSNMAQNLASLMQNLGNFSAVFGNIGKNTGGNMPINMGFSNVRDMGGNQMAATGRASSNQNQSASGSLSGSNNSLSGFGLGNNAMGGASGMSSSFNNGMSGLDALSQAFFGIQQYAASFPNAFGSQGAQQMQGANSGAGKQSEGPDGANLFIYHLPQEFGDQDLMQTFMPFGSVISAKVFVDKMTNVSKCFGFVSYDNAESAQAAIQAMNGFQIGMKRLKVQLKRAKNDCKPY